MPRPKQVKGELTPKQLDFVECFTGPAAGSAFQAAQMAGFSSGSEGARLLKDPRIQLAIARRGEALARIGAVSPVELHAFWRKIMDGDEVGVTTSDRIQVSKLIAQAHGLFVQRTENVNHNFEHNAERIDSMDALLEGLDEDETEALIEFLRWKRSGKRSPKLTVIDGDS